MILEYEFMRNAVISAVLVGIACGMIGVYVVLKRIVFIGGGIAHSAFGGVGIGYFFGINPVITAIPFSIASALGIGVISKKTKVNEDTAIGIMWATGMAIGVIFASLTHGYVPNLLSYLFGNILTVPFSDIEIMCTLDLIILVSVVLFNKEFLAISFDEEYSKIVGINTTFFYLFLLCLVALSVVVLIRIVGVILVIALLTVPATINLNFFHDIKKLMVSSSLTAICANLFGLYISYLFDLPSGATIIMVLSSLFIAVSILKHNR